VSALRYPVSVQQKKRGHSRRLAGGAFSSVKETSADSPSFNLPLKTYTLKKTVPLAAMNVRREATVLLRVNVALGRSLPRASTRWVVSRPPRKTTLVS